ncbi:hypothetical protein H4Q32_000825 [Labeo rohita]|uniref:Uncharacterized protein n=1 Tax=Labeo rohita TaxID=84645 RepID=A0ABQ8LK07_LABRO|nr:hypothetical protein H4Q32_000825 [Labeo rohita]
MFHLTTSSSFNLKREKVLVVVKVLVMWLVFSHCVVPCVLRLRLSCLRFLFSSTSTG